MRLVATGTMAAILISATASSAPVSGEPGPRGYLQPGSFDVIAVLPPAPSKGSARYAADRAIFKATRRFAGTARWDLATNDVKLTPADMMRDFSCALGVTLTADSAPRTIALIERAARDTSRGSSAAKAHYRRLRPFQIDRGPVCQPAEELRNSFDYPSGHATLGWTWATLLAELAPDRATAILARGRAYGESRIVCGVHNASAVEAGRLSAAATLAALARDRAFQSDLEAAAAEIAALRARSSGAAPQSATCTRETGLVAQPIY